MFDYGANGIHNQVTTYAHIDLLTTDPGEPESLNANPPLDGPASAEDRARAYLSVNCAHCHVEGGTTSTSLDLHWQTAFADIDACNTVPEIDDLGIPGSFIVTPGDPSTSVLSLRMDSLGAERMPRVGSKRVDTEAAAVVDEWISALQACP